MAEEPRETRNKILIIVLCLSGIISVGYGVIMDSDGVFVLGIICVIAGYFLIRRKLKESLREKND
ncbi:MAG: hypothetical protein JRJ82_19610 [Deltaproteobacteria bacterium]|nr:hypothetical protein [Deltaproteobacteria bacterium]